MAYLVEFWIILESDLVESAPHGIFVELIWNYCIAYYRLYPNQHILFHWILICYEDIMTFLPETPVFD